jgi:Transposase IS116/IS110/IS902 family
LASTRTLRSTSSPAWESFSALAEFGDDPDRYADAKSRKNYSGMSPITKASGTKRVVLARYARNRRRGDALFLQAYSALRASPGARAFYDRQRDHGATHYQALRALANRLVGILHGCLQTTPATTSTSPGTANQTNSALQLDRFRSWDV